MGNSHSGVFEQKTDLDGLRVTIVPARLHGYAELSSSSNNDAEAEQAFEDIKRQTPQEVTLHLSDTFAVVNPGTNAVTRSFSLDHHVKVFVPRSKSLAVIHPTPHDKTRASVAVFTLASPHAVAEAAAIIDLAQLARESSSRRSKWRQEKQISTYSTGSIPPLNVSENTPAAGPLTPSLPSAPKVRQAWVLQQDLVETLRKAPDNPDATHQVLRKASQDGTGDDLALQAWAGELTTAAADAGGDPNKFDQVARRASEISALMLGVSAEDMELESAQETRTRRLVTRQDSESALFAPISLDARRQSPVSKANRGSGALAATTDELSSLGLGAEVEGRQLHASPCVLIGTAILNTRADRGVIAAGLTAINTGRVDGQGDVDVIRYRGKPATVGLFPGAVLVRMIGQPAAASLPTANAEAAADLDLAVSYGKLTYWGRVFGNKKLVVLVAKGKDHKFLAIYLRFAKKAGVFLGRLTHEWGTLPASYAFQALPAPTVADNVMTFEARLLGVAARRQADDPAAVVAAAGEVVETLPMPCPTVWKIDAVNLVAQERAFKDARGRIKSCSTDTIRLARVVKDKSWSKLLKQAGHQFHRCPLVVIVTQETTSERAEYHVLEAGPNPMTICQTIEQLVQQAFRNRRTQDANPFAVLPTSTSSDGTQASLDSGLAVSSKLQQARIDRQRLKAVRVLGKGHFGQVWLAQYKPNDPSADPDLCAIKMLKRKAPQEDKVNFLREAELCLRFDHPHIVQFLGADVQSEPWLLMLKHVPFGDLRNVLKRFSTHNQRCSHLELCLMMLQMTRAMLYLQKDKYMHLDLALRNLLLGHNNHLVLADFGLSRKLAPAQDQWKTKNPGRMPVKWLDPQAMFKGSFTLKTDVWACGVLLWECWSYGDLPYGTTKGEAYEKEFKAGLRLTQPEQCPDAVFAIAQDCWKSSRAELNVACRFACVHAYTPTITLARLHAYPS
eukprot:m.259382 g.259382  ORF g.259382 m.259382 type:complete len:958 (-) comp17587_c0_seq7:914-3787(-)